MLDRTVLRKKSDFDRIYSKGRSAGSRYVVVFVKPNGLDYNRTAFLASRKVGNSVRRNRARRLMKESYRLSKEEYGTGRDLVFIARSAITEAGCGEVMKSMRAAFARIGVIRKR